MPILSPLAASALYIALNDVRTAKRMQQAFTRDDELGTVTFEAWVAPSGQILDCHVVGVSGSQKLATSFCPVYEQGHIKPARAPDGSPAYSFVKGRITVSSRPRSELPMAPDLSFTIDKVPGRTAEYRVFANLLVNKEGVVVACEAEADVPLSFADQVCSAATADPVVIRKDTSGQPVEYVTGVTASFRKASAAPSQK